LLLSKKCNQSPPKIPTNISNITAQNQNITNIVKKITNFNPTVKLHIVVEHFVAFLSFNFVSPTFY